MKRKIEALYAGATRSAVLALLATLVFTQFSAISHELTTRHVICARHGEVVDLDGRDAGNLLTSSASQEAQLTGLPDEPADGHHHHCLFVSSRGQRNIFKVARPQAVELASLAQKFISGPAEAGYVSGAIYLSAPKHSPPEA